MKKNKLENVETQEEKKKRRHNFLLLALASSMSLSVGAVASYGVSNFRYNRNQDNTGDKNTGDTRTNQDKLLNNLLTSSSLELDTLSASITGFYNEYSIALNGTKVAFNYLDSTLTYQDAVDFNPKFSGNVNLKINESEQKNIADENLGLYIASDKVIVNRENKYYTLDSDAIGDIVGLVSTDSGIDVSGLLSSLGAGESSSSLTDQRNDLLTKIQDCLANSTETVTDSGYDFLLTLPDNLGTVTLSADKSLYFTGVKADLTLTIKGQDGAEDRQVKVSLSAKGKQSTTSNLVSKDLLSKLQEEGVDIVNLNGLDPLFYTAFNLAKSKAFDASVKIGVTDANKATKNATLRLSADLSDKADKDGNKQGKLFQIALNENGQDSYVQGSAKATLRKDTAFIDLNGQKKGYIDYSSVSTRRDSFSSLTGTKDVRNVAESVASLLNDCKLKDLLNGDYSVYKDFLKDRSTNQDGTYAKIVLSSSALGLSGDDNHDRILEIQYESEKNLGRDGIEIQYARASNIPLGDHTLSLEFSLDDLSAKKLTKVESKDGYVSYNGATSLISSLGKIANRKKFGFAYNIGISNSKYNTNYSFDGQLNADLTNWITPLDKSTHPGKNYLDCEASITAHTKRNNVDHYLDARRVGDTSYLSYDNVLKEYRENAEIGNIVDAVRNGVKKRNDASSGSSVDASSVLSLVLDRISSVFSVENGLNLKNLDEYINISSETSDADHTLNRTLSPALFGFEGGLISLKTDSSADKVLSLSVSGLERLGYQFTFTLGYQEYVSANDVLYYGKKFDAAAFKKEAGEPVTKFEYLVNGVFDLFTGEQKYSFSLKAVLNAVDEKAVTTQKASLSGKVNRDIKNSQYNGALKVNIGKDNQYAYQPKLTFDYNNVAKDSLYVQYSGNSAKASPIGINCKKDTISNTISLLKNASTDHSQNLILSLVKTISSSTSSLPILDLVNGKKDPLETVRNSNYVTKIDLRDSKIEVDLDAKAIGLTESEDKTVKVFLTFDSSKGAITGLNVDNLHIQDRTFNLNLDVSSLDKATSVSSLSEIKKTDSVKYISRDDLPLFLQLGLNSTDKQAYTRDGSLRVGIPLINDLVVKARLSAMVSFGDSTKGEKTEYQFYLTLSDQSSSFNTTYYFDSNSRVEGSASLDKGEVLIDYDNGQERTIRYVTTNEFVKHLGYYGLGRGLNFAKSESSDQIYSLKTKIVSSLDGLSLNGTSTTEEGSASATAKDAGGVRGTSILPEALINPDKTGHKDNTFSLGLDLSSIDLGVNGVSLGNDINRKLTHSDNSKNDGTFTSLSLSGELVSILDVASVGIDLELSKVDNFSLTNTVNTITTLYGASRENKAYYQILDGSKVEQKYHHEFLGKGGYYYLSFADNNTKENPTLVKVDKE